MTAKLNIPFFSSQIAHAAIREEMLAAMARVYDSNWYILGQEVSQFEQAYSQFNRVEHTIGVGSGLEALVLALRALGIGSGDEVLVPAHTFIATWLAVTQVGATPVPIEPELTTSNIDPALIAGAMTARTRAVIPVHLYGQPCRMPEILVLAQQYGLWVVEDNAQAQGATFNGQPTGSFGTVNATSFYPTKNLGALGDAGAITTNSQELAHRLRVLRNYGSATKNQHKIVGYNSRLDELQAALLQVKLHYLRQWTTQRQQLAAWYHQYLTGLNAVRLPTSVSGATHVYHLYVIHTPQRDALKRYLAAHGIGTMIHYPVPPHRQVAYANLRVASQRLPIADELATTCLSLPLWPGMTEAMVADISLLIRGFCESTAS